MRDGLLVADVHGHVNPVNGLGPKALASRFRDSGGWLYGLVNLLSWSVDLRVGEAGDFEALYRIYVGAAEEMRSEGLRVSLILGPHPAEAVRLLERGFGIEETLDVMMGAYELAASYVRRGLAQGLGEAGRPHWRVDPKVMELCNEVMGHAISLAADLDVPVHLHLDPFEEALMVVRRYARRADASKIVIHHARGRIVGLAARMGFTPSVPAKISELLSVRRWWGSIVVESDFLDDPRRPGAVVAPWSIRRTFLRLIRRGEMSLENALGILVERPSRLYGIEPPSPGGP